MIKREKFQKIPKILENTQSTGGSKLGVFNNTGF